MDVSGLQPFAEVICPSCAGAVRVRSAFHHFRIVREVGLGGMSRVFGAKDESLGRDLALKILHPSLSEDDKRLRQFEKEAEITASISHPNVVKVFTAGRDQGYFYMAMELVEGGSLDDKIRREGRLPEPWVLELAEHVVEGLKAASEAGLIHRDIKPGNILISSAGTPKIVDFGLAVFARDGVEDEEIWATPFYVPPETLHGEPEDFRSDIYALGSTLYHALMGKPLFGKDTNSLSELKALKAKPADLKEAATVLSPETVAMLGRALKRKPAERYSSYDEFLDHLRYARRRLRRGSRGAAWPGRRGLAPGQWAGLAAALALAGWGLTQWSDSGGESHAAQGGLLLEEDPSLGNDSNVSAKFLAARESLYAEDFVKARQQFGALAADAGTPQPTANWARYNAGLAALLTGDLEAAGKTFEEIRAAGPFSTAPADQELSGFFPKHAGVLASGQAVPAAHAAECPADSTRAIGLLAAGLHNWHIGDLSGAVTFLRAFSSSTPPRSAAWVDRYKKLAQPYLDDVKIIDSLPSLPLTASTPEAAAAQLERGRELVAQLTLPGAARAAAESRLTEFAAGIEAMKEALRRAEEGANESKASTEMAELARIDREIAALGRKLSFGEATAVLRQFKPASSQARQAHDDRLRWWENADSFLDVLLNDVLTPIEASLDRSGAPPLRGPITSNASGLRIKPAGGAEVNLPVTAFTPASLAGLAERLLERTADSDDYYRRRELLVCFARHSGLETYAGVSGRELARENPAFRARWLRQPALR